MDGIVPYVVSLCLVCSSEQKSSGPQFCNILRTKKLSGFDRCWEQPQRVQLGPVGAQRKLAQHKLTRSAVWSRAAHVARTAQSSAGQLDPQSSAYVCFGVAHSTQGARSCSKQERAAQSNVTAEKRCVPGHNFQRRDFQTLNFQTLQTYFYVIFVPGLSHRMARRKRNRSPSVGMCRRWRSSETSCRRASRGEG